MLHSFIVPPTEWSVQSIEFGWPMNVRLESISSLLVNSSQTVGSSGSISAKGLVLLPFLWCWHHLLPETCIYLWYSIASELTLVSPLGSDLCAILNKLWSFKSGDLPWKEWFVRPTFECCYRSVQTSSVAARCMDKARCACNDCLQSQWLLCNVKNEAVLHA